MMKRRNFYAVIALLTVTACFLFFLLIRCFYRPFYSSDDMKKQLEERYALTFQIGDLISQSSNPRRRTYEVSIAEYPDLTCYIVDSWTSCSWSGGQNGVPPIYTLPNHSLWDSCLTASWNQYGVPLLEEYGIYGLEIGESEQFFGVSVHSLYEKNARYLVDSEDDFEQQAEILFGLLEQLRQIPVFHDTISKWNSQYFPVPVRITAGERHTTLNLILTKHMTKEDVLSALIDRLGTIE